MKTPGAITLLELNSRVASVLGAAPGLNDVWVIGETSDLRRSGPHCYLELIDKDPDTGQPVARARATIWASRYMVIDSEFRRATGSPLASGIKIMVKCSVNYHPLYGLSLNITDVNPEFTLGDLLRRRRELIDRLTREGIIELNRRLVWAVPPTRIAVISAPGAAGYGDFINQLYTNPARLRFTTELFPAVMQGEHCAESVVDALGRIAARSEEFDGVVIIRGGGATGDLAAFDDYALAAHIAMFPLPVMIGIGHERDITLLDYVANQRVKTPTAAAEWLISRGTEALERVRVLGAALFDTVNSAIQRSHRRLENIAGSLPALAQGVLLRASQRVGPSVSQTIEMAVTNAVRHRKERLTALAALVDTLSPEATLRRGFSITRLNGRAISDSAETTSGDTIQTTLATGTITSIVK
ncbi:MAG: exodeoxyribonuclease VII large subunit [Muribaculaceae bacterium]|nr:exodeoxyribonuclease VII large subunit [Muribaculaceae bacterium]